MTFLHGKNIFAPSQPARLSNMPFLARDLLISGVTLGLSFTTHIFAVAPSIAFASQEPNKVSVQSGASSGSAGTPVVTVSVDKKHVGAGDVATFNVSPASVVTDPNFRVIVDFGDGTRRRVTAPTIAHQYRVTGNYKVSAIVLPAERESVKGYAAPVPRVALSAQSSSAGPVTLRAQISSPYPNLKYRFNFGDGSQTDWQNASEATHNYRTPGKYQVYVDVGTFDDGGARQLGGSMRQAILVPAVPSVVQTTSESAASRTPSTLKTEETEKPAASVSPTPLSVQTTAPPFVVPTADTTSTSDSSATSNVAGSGTAFGSWWKYLPPALLLLGVAYWLWKTLVVSRGKVMPIPDIGGAEVEGGADGLTIESQFTTHPNVSQAQYLVYSDDESVVRNVRRENA